MLTGDLLVLPFAPGGFSLCTTVFPSPQKPTFPNSNSTRNQVEEEPLTGCATCTSKSLFNNIYLFIYKLAQGKHSLLICYWHYILTTGLLFTFKSCLKGTTCNNLCILIWQYSVLFNGGMKYRQFNFLFCVSPQKLCTPQTVNCRDLEGRHSTPLHFAAGYNRVTVVEYLLQNGADVHAKDKG